MILLLLACNPSHDPAWVAHQACIVVPGIHVDGASQALGVDAIHPDELKLWHDDASYGTAGYGPVYAEIGLEGAGVIRANSYCTLVSLTEDEATLTRREPDLSALETWDTEAVWELPRVERSVTLKLESTPDGYRARSGAEQARKRAFDAEAMLEARPADAVAAYQALHADFPDPRILWRIHQIEALPLERLPLDGVDQDGQDGGELLPPAAGDADEHEGGQGE